MVKLYSDPQCPNSHRTRIVLQEKELPVDCVELEPDNLPEDFMNINPSKLMGVTREGDAE